MVFLVTEDEKTNDIIGFIGVVKDYSKIKDKLCKSPYIYDLRTNLKYKDKVPKWLRRTVKEAEDSLGIL